jgi:hypothetical protein
MLVEGEISENSAKKLAVVFSLYTADAISY